jgi:hypothetical protein
MVGDPPAFPRVPLQAPGDRLIIFRCNEQGDDLKEGEFWNVRKLTAP